jgi:hypothetical protein
MRSFALSTYCFRRRCVLCAADAGLVTTRAAVFPITKHSTTQPPSTHHHRGTSPPQVPLRLHAPSFRRPKPSRACPACQHLDRGCGRTRTETRSHLQTNTWSFLALPFVNTRCFRSTKWAGFGGVFPTRLTTTSASCCEFV